MWFGAAVRRVWVVEDASWDAWSVVLSPYVGVATLPVTVLLTSS